MPKHKKSRSPLVRAGNTWTEGRYQGYIMNTLRKGSRIWPPRSEALRAARTSRGLYRCSICQEEVPVTITVNGKRKKNIEMDHVIPIIDVDKGFTSWDDFVERLFVEQAGWQVLCLECHKNKTISENKGRVDGRRKRKV